MSNKSTPAFVPDEFVPELRQEFDKTPLDITIIWCCGMPAAPTSSEHAFVPSEGDKHDLIISDGKVDLYWTAPPLRSLFRGNKKPPTLGDYPEEYDIIFAILETHFLDICDLFGDRTDLEMKEIYAALRKRPDGKSLGFVQDHMWRGAALALGTHILSQAEFEAILSRLERSCRTFETGPSSRNYVKAVRMTLNEGGFE